VFDIRCSVFDILDFSFTRDRGTIYFSCFMAGCLPESKLCVWTLPE